MEGRIRREDVPVARELEEPIMSLFLRIRKAQGKKLLCACEHVSAVFCPTHASQSAATKVYHREGTRVEPSEGKSSCTQT